MVAPRKSARNGTHVILPIAEYRQMQDAARVLRLLEIATDDAREWIDADDSAAQLAGSRVRKARLAKGLTQKQVAEKLGVPQSQVSRIEHHPDRSTIQTLKRIAKVLGVDVRALL